jgi:hypothetical protein
LARPDFKHDIYWTEKLGTNVRHSIRNTYLLFAAFVLFSAGGPG